MLWADFNLIVDLLIAGGTARDTTPSEARLCMDKFADLMCVSSPRLR